MQTLITCPHCGATSESGDIGTCEKIDGTSWLYGINEDGTFEFSGETKMHWDSSETQTDEHKRVIFWCGNCDQEFTLEGVTQ